MARLKGKLKHRWKEKDQVWAGEIKGDNGKKYQGLSAFDFAGIERGECDFEVEGNKVTAIWVDEKPVPQNYALVERKAQEDRDKKRRKAEAEEKQRREDALDEARNGGVYHPALAPFLPEDVAAEMEFLPDGPDNYSLKLNQTANWEENGEKAILFRADRGSGRIQQYVPVANYGFTEGIWGELSAKLTRQVESIGNSHETFTLPQSLGSRLVIGLGTATVFETGILLHPVYGFPYLPATSLKGITRAWIVDCCFESEEEAIEDPSFLQMFGSTDQIGSLLFFDAFPTHAPTIKEDIMNPHYPKYYTGEEPPADYQSPVPIPFLTVENTSFQFLIGFKPLPELEDPTVSGPIARQLGKNNGELSLLEAGKQWLLKALSEHGIGAKTALGYGFFQSPQT